MMLCFDRVVGELGRSGAHPRLTWSSATEHLELSGHVVANWSIKVANLLLQESAAGPGARVGLSLPTHWRTAVWALGTWLTGACVVVHPALGSGQDLDLVATDDPEAWAPFAAAGVPTVAVPLPSFALRWPGDLASGMLDGGSDVAGQPDALGPVEPADPDAPALILGGEELLFDDLRPGLWFALDAVYTWSEGGSPSIMGS